MKNQVSQKVVFLFFEYMNQRHELFSYKKKVRVTISLYGSKRVEMRFLPKLKHASPTINFYC